MNNKIIIIFIISFQLFAQMGSHDSGGPLLPEQAAYDVKFYKLDLTIDPDQKLISGSNYVEAKILSPLNLLIFNLDTAYNVDRVVINDNEVNFIHSEGLIKAELENVSFKIGETISSKIYYSGYPPEARTPPWDDGFVWAKTKSDADWIGVTCQGSGGDIWWPCKDHPSDEPDSVSLLFTVPSELFCASNGVLVDSIDNEDGTSTFEWFMDNPINNYNITLNIAPYKKIEHTFKSVAGDKFPVEFYVLPESYDTAKVFTDQFLHHLKFYEKYCGPYPFRSSKYGIAESPYLGMEHQTIIAYGNGYKNNEYGFDWLHHHELAHEWWGNLVTAKDWSDFWIHEGIGTYMQALYAEELLGKEGLVNYMQDQRRFMNTKPVKQKGSKSVAEAYTPDIYFKAAWMVHTLRYYLGDDHFFEVLRRWAYPSEELENVTDGSQCRFTTTKEVINIAEDISGKKLTWLFDNYLYIKELPELEAVLIKREFENELKLKWKNPAEANFILPVEVQIGDETKKIEMDNETGSLSFPAVIIPVIDPNKWILMKDVKMETYSKKGF